MVFGLELAPKQKRPAGERCCEPLVYPDVERQEAERMAEIAKALGDPVRLQLIDVLRKHAGKVCVCMDVVISNCVLNLSADKRRVIEEAARVLRPGGRFAVSDIIADPEMDEFTRADMEQWTGCIAGALTRAGFERILTDAGFEDLEIRETHRVHQHAGAAILRGRLPASSDAAPSRSCSVGTGDHGGGRGVGRRRPGAV